VFNGVVIIHVFHDDNVLAGEKQQNTTRSGNDIHHVGGSRTGDTWKDNVNRPGVYTTRSGSFANSIQKGCDNSCHVFSLPNLQTTRSASLPNMQQMYKWDGPSLSVDE